MLSELIHTYWRSIWAFIYSMTGDADLTSDLAQDTFVRACQRFSQLRDATHVKTWLFSIAKNRCRDHYKSAWVRKVVPFGTSAALAPLATVPSVEQEVLQEVERNDVWQAIFSLKAEFREVVLLRVREDLAFREVAAVLGIREGTARSRYVRAVSQLRAKLGEGGDVDGV